MLYKEYDKGTLEKLQKLELGILEDFCRLCEENNIDYFGVGGTGIGAVRHGGFIPWDDDIDVGMTRENYDRFLEIAQEKYSYKYKVINAETTPNYPLMTTRWAIIDSKFKEDAFRELDVDNGIFLDMYCFDNIADDDRKMRRQGWCAWFWGKLLILRSIKRPVLYFGGWKARVVYFICGIAYYGMKFLHISPGMIYKKAKKYATKYKGKQTKRVAYFFDPTPFTSIMDLSEIVPTRPMAYSGLTVRFPNKLEAYLDRRYGDYMKLPPEDKRHNHPPYILEFPTDK